MSKTTSTKKVQKIGKRSKKYSANFAKIKEVMSKNLTLDVKEACKLLFDLEQPKYEASVEIHFKLNINPTKSDQIIRSSLVLPHGSGKKVVVAAFVSQEKVEEAKKAGADIVGGEELVEEIKTSQKVNFDKAIAEPAMMKKLPAIARILGVAGVMPNPKNNTVGENITEMIKAIKGGKVDFKNDKSANIHFTIGKINKEFTPETIYENFQAALDAVEKAKPEVIKKYILSCHLASSISPSIRVL
jgi:large subunit ribosomal protein L1